MFAKKKQKREEIEKKRTELIFAQRNARNNMKCKICGGSNFTMGAKGVHNFNVYTSAIFKDDEFPMRELFYLCETCGHIETFVEFNTIPPSCFKH